MEGSGSSESSNTSELLKLKTALKNEEVKNFKLHSQIFEKDKLRKDLEVKLESEKRLRKEEQLKLESVVYQISKQYNDILENMVEIFLNQGRSSGSATKTTTSSVKVEFEGLKQVSGILKSLKEKIELLEEDYETMDVGSVLTGLVTLSCMVRRMKNKRAPSTSTSSTTCDATNVETTTSTAPSAEPTRISVGPPTFTNLAAPQPGPVASETSPIPPIVTLTSAQAESGPGMVIPKTKGDQLEEGNPVDTSTGTSGESNRRSGRLKITLRRTYSDQLEEYEQTSGRRRRGKGREPKPNVVRWKPCAYDDDSFTKTKKRLHVCPYSQCGKRFTRRKNLKKHVIGHDLFDDAISGDSQSLKQQDENGGGSNGKGVTKMDGVEPANLKASVAKERSTPGAVGGEMLSTNGVTISVSRKRPRKNRSSTLRTNQVGRNLKLGGAGEEGTGPGLTVGESPCVKMEQE